VASSQAAAPRQEPTPRANESNESKQLIRRQAEGTGWRMAPPELRPWTVSKMKEAAGDSDWLLSLASKAVAADVGNSGTSPRHPTLSKAERIERRRRKKSEREQRRTQTLLKKRNVTRGVDADQATDNTESTEEPRSRKKHEGISRASKRTLRELATRLSEAHSSSEQATRNKTKKRKARDQGDDCVTLKNGISAEPKGKATKQSTLRHDSKELQPRARDYNGQGLARPSIFLQLNDPSFLPKVELEFGEHIEGFFGRTKTRSSKKQETKGMLWKRCLDEKIKRNASTKSS
ncbi:hypothetical protein THAOC_24341, partial [Thalassiosira oceanica]